MSQPAAPCLPSRLLSIDALRGLVMILMALDHVRDFFGLSTFSPTDLDRTTPAWFFTRWITHLCAPVFVFLAGAGAYLWAKKSNQTPTQLTKFLLIRGLWMLFLEFSVIGFGWSFESGGEFPPVGQVFWAIGIAMIALAGLSRLGVKACLIAGASLVAGHSLLDPIDSMSLGSFEPLWTILHKQGIAELPGGIPLFVLYPILPWIGVMALGYAAGPVFSWDAKRRATFLLQVGFAALFTFVILRSFNLYGDFSQWGPHPKPGYSVLSFLNCSKYPPSFLYLLMTLGPGALLLVLLERFQNAVWIQPLVDFGRVPLFYYIAHLYLAHGGAWAIAYLRGARSLEELRDAADLMRQTESVYRFQLPGIYLAWIVIVVSLYPVCRWFSQLKKRSTGAWTRFV